MLFKSHDLIPPGGWRFRQPQTGWPAPEEFVKMSTGFTFQQWVDAIIAHRASNPRFNLSTDPAVVAGEVELFTALSMRNLKGAAHYLVTPEVPLPKTLARYNLPAAVAGVVAGVVSAVKQASVGTATILDWLGSGGEPVDEEMAKGRSNICLGCPNNQDTHWSTWANTIAAKAIGDQLAAKKQLNLSLIDDGKLKTCSACGCWLPLKVWVPIDHIKENTAPDVEAALAPGCWYFTETKQPCSS